MRRARALFFKVIEVIGVLGLVACIVIGITVTRAARVSEPQSASEKAAAHKLPAKVVAEVRRTLEAGLRFVPGPDATGVAPDTPVVVTAPAGELGTVHLMSAS